MIYVEGAQKFIRQYKRLMLHRIAWTEAARPRGEEEVEIEEGDGEEGTEGKGKERAGEVANPEGEGVTSLEDNACYLVWEGLLRERAFSSFKPRSCPTDGVAKEALGQKLAGYWDITKNWKPEEEELF